jgi:hypothetical protein
MKISRKGFQVIALGVAVMMCGAAAAYSIPWSSINGGGTTFSSGGGWVLAGTIGQHEASQAQAISGGDWSVTGGFWVLPFELGAGDFIFQDRFED